MKRSRMAYPYIFVWMPLFIVAPLLFVLYYAFFRDGQFTTDFVVQVFSDTTYLPALLNSIWIALATTVVCLLVGYPVAYILSNMKSRSAALLSMLFIMPMWMNMLLRTIAWKILLDDSGIIVRLLEWLGMENPRLIYTPGAVLVATIYDFLPFMILPIYTVLQKLDRSLIEAAHDLGANSRQTFLRVVLPQSVPGIVSGITMVFVPSMSTFAVSTMLGGKNVMLFGQVIEQKFLIGNQWGVGSTLSLVLIVLVLISMFIMRRVERDTGSEGGTIW